MARGGRSAYLSRLVALVGLCFLAPTGSAPSPVFGVATDPAVGKYRLEIPDSQDLIKDQ
jgi:hypothetical protein